MHSTRCKGWYRYDKMVSHDAIIILSLPFPFAKLHYTVKGWWNPLVPLNHEAMHFSTETRSLLALLHYNIYSLFTFTSLLLLHQTYYKECCLANHHPWAVTRKFILNPSTNWQQIWQWTKFVSLPILELHGTGSRNTNHFTKHCPDKSELDIKRNSLFKFLLRNGEVFVISFKNEHHSTFLRRGWGGGGVEKKVT